MIEAKLLAYRISMRHVADRENCGSAADKRDQQQNQRAQAVDGKPFGPADARVRWAHRSRPAEPVARPDKIGQQNTTVTPGTQRLPKGRQTSKGGERQQQNDEDAHRSLRPLRRFNHGFLQTIQSPTAVVPICFWTARVSTPMMKTMIKPSVAMASSTSNGRLRAMAMPHRNAPFSIAKDQSAVARLRDARSM